MAPAPARASTKCPSLTPKVRFARPDDLDAVDSIEARAFTGDRFPRRNLARLLKSGSAATLLAQCGEGAGGYALVLFRKGSPLARLYSIAVAPEARGHGLGGLLLEKAEIEAQRRGADRVRLEVRSSNRAARALYERAGYLEYERKPGYYPDGEDAVRMEKRLKATPKIQSPQATA